MSTFLNVLLIVVGAAVAVGGIFGEGYDREKLAASKWWQARNYVTKRGWVMLSLTLAVIALSVWKYNRDFADAQTKETQLSTDRDDWKKKAQERARSMQDRFDSLNRENETLQDELAKQGGEASSRLQALKEQNDALAGRSETLRHQLEDLKRESEAMVLATAIAGSTTSASVLKASGDLQGQIQSTTDVLHASVVQYNDALFHLVTDLQQKELAPMHAVLDGRGGADGALPTIRNIRDECVSPAEVENILRGPIAKSVCPACTCTCNPPPLEPKPVVPVAVLPTEASSL